MAESSFAKKGKTYQNDFYHQLLEKLMQSKTPDVHFVFNGVNGVVKVPAHKELLSISSSVFNAMFNGELKEKGDVVIVDASVDGFNEFLQFFYSKKVDLTMDNIADVLNLAHKYDVTECFATAVRFLKEHLTADKMMWGLQLALKYQSDELKTLCKDQIAEDIESALNVFQFHDSDGMSISATDQMLSNTNLASLWMEVFSLSKKIHHLTCLRDKWIPFILSCSDVYSHEKVSDAITIKFDPKSFQNALWLREIHFAKFYEKSGESFKEIPLRGTVSIIHYNSLIKNRFDFEEQFANVKHINFSKPLLFDSKFFYYITVKLSVPGYPSMITNEAIKDKLTICDAPKYTLISRLYFEELPNI